MMRIEELTICAFRYSLGRKSSVVGQMIKHLEEIWHTLKAETKELIKEETEEAIKEKACGMEMDYEAWKKFLKGRANLETIKEV